MEITENGRDFFPAFFYSLKDFGNAKSYNTTGFRHLFRDHPYKDTAGAPNTLLRESTVGKKSANSLSAEKKLFLLIARQAHGTLPGFRKW